MVVLRMQFFVEFIGWCIDLYESESCAIVTQYGSIIFPINKEFVKKFLGNQEGVCRKVFLEDEMNIKFT